MLDNNKFIIKINRFLDPKGFQIKLISAKNLFKNKEKNKKNLKNYLKLMKKKQNILLKK